MERVWVNSDEGEVFNKVFTHDSVIAGWGRTGIYEYWLVK